MPPDADGWRPDRLSTYVTCRGLCALRRHLRLMSSGVCVHRDRCRKSDDLTSITEENAMAQVSLGRKAAAEFIGTFWLTFGGCGSAVLAAAFQTGTEGSEPRLLLGIGLLGVSFAFGLTVLTGAYAFGHISGGHFNPAVSFGLWAGKRFPGSELVPYIIAQVAGAIVAAAILYLIASGKDGFSLLPGGLASNGYGSALARQVCAVLLLRGRSRLDLYVFNGYLGGN